jgi:hypothetical protein
LTSSDACFDVFRNAELRKPVLAFVFGEKGLMGDASLQGGKISKIATK